MLADLTQTDTEDVFTSPSHPEFTFYKVQTSTLVVLAHQQLQRHHRVEDKNDPEAEAALDELPSSLWVSHQADGGLISVSPVSFAIDLSILSIIHNIQLGLKP